jgi:flagellar biosynthetic protein FliR
MMENALLDALVPILLINARVSGLLLFGPVFGHSAIPATVKAAILMMFSITLYFGFDVGAGMGKLLPGVWLIGILSEFAVGALMALVLQLFFAAFSFAGGIIAPQMGMAVSQLLDPQSQSMQPLLASFFSLVAILFFLAIDGHLIMLQGLYDSYRLVPITGFQLSGPIVGELVRLGGQMFVIALKISAPPLAVIIFLNTGMALMARAVPQINVLVVGFISTISVGMISLTMMLPVVRPALTQYAMEALQNMLWIFKAS